jgi:hypothetical protein
VLAIVLKKELLIIEHSDDKTVLELEQVPNIDDL